MVEGKALGFPSSFVWRLCLGSREKGRATSPQPSGATLCLSLTDPPQLQSQTRGVEKGLGERGPPSHSGPAANPADHEGCSALPCLGQQAPAQTAPSSWVVLSPREEWDSRKNWVLHRECSTFQRFLRGWQVVPWPSTSDRHSCVLQADPQSEEVASSSLTSPQALERVWGRGPKHQAKTLPESHHQATSWPHLGREDSGSHQ